MRWTYRLSWRGFGFGAWRNVYYPGDAIWTIAIGIITIHIAVDGKDASK